MIKKKQSRNAFTILELIFVIVILGVLAAVALPRMGTSMEAAYVAQAQGDVSAVRAAIASARQKQLVRGINGYITQLSTSNARLFDGNGTEALLMYPITPRATGGWTRTQNLTYRFTVDANNFATFTYTPATGRFDCDHNQNLCQRIVE